MKKFLIFSGVICFCQIVFLLFHTCPAVEGSSGNVFDQSIILSGTVQEDVERKPLEYNIYRESLIVRDGRVYIYSASVGRTRKYFMLHYLLPETVQFDPETKEIVYIDKQRPGYKDGDKRLVIGRSKKFLKLVPYIALSKNVKILSSPYGAKLIITPRQEKNAKSVNTMSGNPGEMTSILQKKCSQCHVIDFILTHKEWTEDDCLHVFSRLQAKEPFKLSEKEQKLVEKFKVYQRVALSSKNVKRFNKLREMGRKDIRSIAECVYEDSCAPCHSPDKMGSITRRYPKRRCATIVQRMQEKDPALFLDANADALADFLWQLKIRPAPGEG